MSARPTLTPPISVGMVGQMVGRQGMSPNVVGRMAEANKLTARGVKGIATPGMHPDGRGLYLLVAKSGAKSWIFRYQLNRRRREMGLGSLDTVSLARARDLADEKRKLVAAGIDPIEERDREAEAATEHPFRDVAKAYIQVMTPGWKSAKHCKQWESTLETYAYPVIGSLDVGAIGTEKVLEILKPIWTVKPETASRVRQRIESVLDYSTSQGWRSGENPARWRSHLVNLLAPKSKIRPVRHFPAMPYIQLPVWWPRLLVHDGRGARALEFTILTAARSHIVRFMPWTEVDFEDRSWMIPAERMKWPRDFRVPLSDAAIAVLRKQEAIRYCDLVFPGMKKRGAMSDMTMLKVLRDMGLDYTVHGFRSTFRDWVAEMTSHPSEVAEMALAHTIPSKTEQAYRRGELFDKRRALMDDWAGYVTKPTARLVAI